MVRIKHLFIAFLALVLLLAATCWLTRDFWFEQLGIYARGTLHLAAEKYGYKLPAIDRVELSVLGIGGGPSADGFPQLVGGMVYYPIASQKSITGDDANEFAKKWRLMTFKWELDAACHEPAYGLRFFNKDTLVFETTLCWKCSNFYVATRLGYSFCGFQKRSPEADAVWELLQKHAPLPDYTRKDR